MTGLLIAVVLTLFNVVAWADDGFDEALVKTGSDLSSPEERAKMKTSVEGENAMSAVSEVAGGDKVSEQKIYELSASVLQTMGKDAASPDTLARRLEQSKDDPEGFTEGMTADQLAKLREIAGEIDRKKKKP